MSDSGSEFTRCCLILYFSADRFKVHGLPASLEQGNYTVNICPRLYSKPGDEINQVDIVIFDIASKKEAALAETFIEKYRYVVNRWISFNWKYPVFDIAMKYGLNPMSRRAMNHRRGIYKIMSSIDQEITRLSLSIFDVLNPEKHEELEYSVFAEAAKAVGIDVSDSQFHEIVTLLNPGDHAGFSAAQLEKFMRRSAANDTLSSVIQKVIANKDLLAGMSESTSARYGVRDRKPTHAEAKISIGEEGFPPGLSMSFSATNHISPSEEELMTIGELLPTERENYFALSFRLRDDVSEEVATEYFESVYNERQMLRSISEIYISIGGYIMGSACISWKYRVHDRKVHVFGVINLPMVMSSLFKKFDPLTPFLDPKTMDMSFNIKVETQADASTLIANYPESVGSTFLSDCRITAEGHLCPNTLRLLDLFACHVTTASSSVHGMQIISGILDLFGVGNLDLKVPSVEVLPEKLLEKMNVILGHFIDPLRKKLEFYETLSTVELRLGYSNQRIHAQISAPRLNEFITPPKVNLMDFIRELKGRRKPDQEE